MKPIISCSGGVKLQRNLQAAVIRQKSTSRSRTIRLKVTLETSFPNCFMRVSFNLAEGRSCIY